MARAWRVRPPAQGVRPSRVWSVRASDSPNHLGHQSFGVSSCTTAVGTIAVGTTVVGTTAAGTTHLRLSGRGEEAPRLGQSHIQCCVWCSTTGHDARGPFYAPPAAGRIGATRAPGTPGMEAYTTRAWKALYKEDKEDGAATDGVERRRRAWGRVPEQESRAAGVCAARRGVQVSPDCYLSVQTRSVVWALCCRP